jgi:SAM-dependent methyltransferase
VSDRSWKSLKTYLLYRRHLFAYEHAMSAARPGAIWVDIGSGFGYALQRLSEKARHILAIDMAWTALRSLPEIPRVSKLRGDASRLPLASGSIDDVTCFQVIEHLESDLALRLLEEIVRVLAPGGSAFLTTPNARWRLQPPTNPYHVVEYGPDEIVDLCRAAGIPAASILGVVGVDGAQEIELARLAKNPLQARGMLSARGWRELLTRERPTRLRSWKRLGKRSVEPEDQGRDWFALTDDHSNGLDFWIQISK